MRGSVPSVRPSGEPERPSWQGSWNSGLRGASSVAGRLPTMQGGTANHAGIATRRDGIVVPFAARGHRFGRARDRIRRGGERRGLDGGVRRVTQVRGSQARFGTILPPSWAVRQTCPRLRRRTGTSWPASANAAGSSARPDSSVCPEEASRSWRSGRGQCRGNRTRRLSGHPADSGNRESTQASLRRKTARLLLAAGDRCGGTRLHAPKTLCQACTRLQG